MPQNTSSDSNDDPIVWRQMEAEMIDDNDDELENASIQTEDFCLGCQSREGDGLKVQCNICDSWWHTGCRQSVKGLNDEPLIYLI